MKSITRFHVIGSIMAAALVLSVGSYGTAYAKHAGNASQKGITGGNARMADTHKLGDAAKQVADLLDKMPAAEPMKMK
jgi:hypothetical protein